jgi:guanylate kinase
VSKFRTLNNPTPPAAGPGRLIVIAAPSGAGKTTLVRGLMRLHPELQFSISFTTRPPRATEVPGRDYHFVSQETFETMLAANAFLEHASVFDHYYGTSRQQVAELLAAGRSVILEIDWQGARQVRRQMPECRSVFILPPSVAELKRRLVSRGTDTPAVIERRFRDALSDMSHWREFDYAVINAELPAATAELAAIALDAPGNSASRTDNAALQQRVAAIFAEAAETR